MCFIIKLMFKALEITKTVRPTVRPTIALTCLMAQKSWKETTQHNNFIWIESGFQLSIACFIGRSISNQKFKQNQMFCHGYRPYTVVAIICTQDH